MNLHLQDPNLALRKKKLKNKLFIKIYMGQKTNPLVFKLNHTNNWESKYFEKKSTEHSILNFKDIEIRNFTKRFFEYNGLLVHDLKISYYDTTITIFMSYFSTLESVSLINSENKAQKTNFIGKKIKPKNFNKFIQLYKNNLNFYKSNKLACIKELNKKLKYSNRNNSAQSIIKRKFYNLKRIKSLQIYKNYLLTKQNSKKTEMEAKFFLNKFFTALSTFINAKCNISLVLNRVNNNIRQKTTKSKLKILKKNLVKLRKYEQNFFFKEGVNILFLAIRKKNSANLLSCFIASQLQKLKRHNFFMRFLKNSLVSFYNKNLLNGMKIKIKGRFNGAPRSRHRIITIGDGVPVLTINNNLDYGESVSFTPNGTFGVKVWISRKIKNNVCLQDQNKQNIKKFVKVN